MDSSVKKLVDALLINLAYYAHKKVRTLAITLDYAIQRMFATLCYIPVD